MYCVFVVVFLFFFFKQKTAYEMRISDWSSDVCSSDLGATLFFTTLTRVALPTTSSPTLIAPLRRISRRTDASSLSALPPVVVSGLPYITPIFMSSWLRKDRTSAVTGKIVSVRVNVGGPCTYITYKYSDTLFVNES